jgi:hypothetical protein
MSEETVNAIKIRYTVLTHYMFENLSFCSQNKVATNFVLTVSSGCDLEQLDTEEYSKSSTVYTFLLASSTRTTNNFYCTN